MESSDDPRQFILSLMDTLNKTMPEFRKQQGLVAGLKYEIAATNVRIAAADPKLSASEFNRLVERYLDAW